MIIYQRALQKTQFSPNRILTQANTKSYWALNTHDDKKGRAKPQEIQKNLFVMKKT